MSKKTIAFVLAGILVLALGLSGCGGQQQADQAKVLRAAGEATFAPFEFQDEKTNELAGFDVDLIKAIGKQMGYEVQYQNQSFDGLIPALDSGNIDIAISGMTITSERAQKVNFSKPYYKSGLTILVKKDDDSIKGFKDLAGKNIAVQIGTTGSMEAKKIPDAKVREFNSAAEAIMELKAGGVDAVVNDMPVNEYYLVQSGGQEAKSVGERLTSEDYGIATAKKNTELNEKINKALDELKQNGEYEKIYVKWFGVKPE